MAHAKILVGESSFARLREENAYYVDKTAFLERIIHDGNRISLITRPRRFGKTLLQTTLQAFLALDPENPDDRSRAWQLFTGLSITDNASFCAEHLGRWPVLFLKLKDVNGENFEQAVASLSNSVTELAQENAWLSTHPHLPAYLRKAVEKLLELSFLSFDEQLRLLRTSLSQLMQALSMAFKRKVVVLIDEYDVPLNLARVKGFYEDMLALLREMFGRALKDNPLLQKSVLTGCLRLARESVFSEFNNFGCHGISDPTLAAAMGFTAKEAQKILSDFCLSAYADKVGRRYDGYRFGNEEIYCPWDLMSFCRDATTSGEVRFLNYWINTSSNSLIAEFLRFADAQHLEHLHKLLKGETVVAGCIQENLSFSEIAQQHSPEHLLSLLFCSGYLTADKKNKDGEILLRIPNEEVHECFERQIKAYFSSESTDYVSTGRLLANFLCSGQGMNANAVLQQFLSRYMSVRDGSSESFYHGLILSLLGTSPHLAIDSNREAGDGYFDIRLIDTHSSSLVILELKKVFHVTLLSEAASSALRQIHDRNYAEYFSGGIRKVYLYGMSFCGKHCLTLQETHTPMD